MDAPWSQRGENTHNTWSDAGIFRIHGVAVMVDNFAIPAATIRGLFDYDYRSDRLVLRPRVPGCITQYTQKQPVRFGEKHLYISCRNGGPKVKSVAINGKRVKVHSPEAVVLMYDGLPNDAKIEIITEGGWPRKSSTTVYPAIPALLTAKDTEAAARAELPESLQQPFAILSAMSKLLSAESGADYERAFIKDALASCEAYRIRAMMEPGPGYYRPITAERREGVNKFFERTALGMYEGFARRMAVYAEGVDARQKRVAALFSVAKKQKDKNDGIQSTPQ
jgi:hypothetical protein